MSKKKKLNNFWKRIRFKYRVSVINESTLEEVWNIRASIFKGIILALLVGFWVVAITAVIIIATPIRYFLPGYLDSEVRQTAIQTAINIDSLEQKIQAQEIYFTNVQKILDGTMDIDSIASVPDTIFIPDNDPSLQKTENEREFVNRYGEEEKYNLSVLPASAAPNAQVILYLPIRGVITRKFSTVDKHFGIDIQPSSTAAVVAVMDGTIIDMHYDIENGYILRIQHKNGFLSVYSNCSRPLVTEVGYVVRQGTPIAMMDVKTKKDFHFELWYNGVAVDPQEYMTF